MQQFWYVERSLLQRLLLSRALFNFFSSWVVVGVLEFIDDGGLVVLFFERGRERERESK
jgi:hypothetical protein